MKNKLCLAYIWCGDRQDVNFDEQLKQIDFKKLTHICIAFSLIKENGGYWLPYISEELAVGIKKIQEEIKAQNADTKILLSVGGAYADGFCMASRTKENRRLFAQTIVDIIDEFDLDGVDVDWEYPGESMLGITCCEHCKSDFIQLLEELRSLLKSRYLTVAVGSNRYIGIDVKKLGSIVDYVFVMTYDLGVMHSNVLLSKLFVTMWKILGIQRHKLCIGVPIYGKNVKNLNDTLNYCELSKGRITHYLGQSFSEYNGEKYSFDTDIDVEKKARWALKNDLGGVFCWEITGDENNRMLNAMNRGIHGKNDKNI
ncbi:MAG: glycoside hydrolase family 18 protein [Eubacterium sp.]